MAAQENADVKHRRLGCMNPRNMLLFRKIDANGDDDYKDDITGCDIYICSCSESAQQAHPKREKYSIAAPMQLVYTDRVEPISPPPVRWRVQAWR